MNKKHIGSNFDDFLREEKLLVAVETSATKRVSAFQVEIETKRSKLTKRLLVAESNNATNSAHRPTKAAGPAKCRTRTLGPLALGHFNGDGYGWGLRERAWVD